MNTNCPRLVIAGERGEAGKTIVSIGLLAAWRARGLRCAAFKKGPDYIDSAWLRAASGGPCRNLDSFLMGEEIVARSFCSHAIEDGVNLIEGNRGLFDGVDPEGTFSTAELAKLLDSPVILVVDCKKRTRTTAALVLGCRMLDPDVNVVGVVLNRLGTERHERITRAAIENFAGVPVFGAVPKLTDPRFHERQLGLVPPQEQGRPDEAIEAARKVIEDSLDVEAIWHAAMSCGPLDLRFETCAEPTAEPVSGGPRIGYFLDTVFHFYYPENLEALERRGAELVAIDAQQSNGLPEDLDGLYIGGGFPEERAPAISANRILRESVRNAADRGLPIYAECGGLMYLGRSLKTADSEYPMAGVFPFSTVMEPKPQGHGYIEADVVGDAPVFDRGSAVRGHEFHYSRPVDWDESEIDFAFSIKRGRGFSERRDGLVYRNTFATYVHLHALGEPQWAARFVDLCFKYRQDGRSGRARSTVSAVAGR